MPGHQSARDILLILATKLGDQAVVEAINTKYSEFVKPNGDLSEQLLQLFGCGAFVEQSPTVKVLKCINQEIVYPAVMVLRKIMYDNPRETYSRLTEVSPVLSEAAPRTSETRQ